MYLYRAMGSFCAMQVFFLSFSSIAQPLSDSLIHVADLYPVAFYGKKLEPSAKFFNGREYRPYQAAKNETPYLFSEWVEADLEYDEQHYGPVPIMLDLRTNAVIINYRSGLLQLVKERLSKVIIKDRAFVLLHPAGLSADFYELLYDGNIKVYSHRQKKIKEWIDGMNIVREFEEFVQFYVMIKNDMHGIKSKNDFLELFTDRGPQLKEHIGKKKLRFKKDFEKDLIELSMFCDRL
jgi:hypothetical protein